MKIPKILKGAYFGPNLVSPKLEHFTDSTSDGGHRAIEKIGPNVLVAAFGGHVIPAKDYFELDFAERDLGLQIAPDYFLGPRSFDQVDITDFFNHSCQANCGIWGRNLLVTMREIAAGEEIFFDYAMTDVHPLIKPFDCLCGTELCRGVVQPGAYLDPKIQARYTGNFSLHIERLITGNKRLQFNYGLVDIQKNLIEAVPLGERRVYYFSK